ncbi:MAG: antitoxin of toxin-antitoxin stability system [bacterium]|nr:MAG: antitoxin of toxin-antitoxin stability system [bacterium]
MLKVNLETDIKPLAEVRASITACIEQVHKTGRPLVITKQGKSAAILLDVSVYEALMERLELLEDIRTAEAQITEGNLISQQEVEEKFFARFK